LGIVGALPCTGLVYGVGKGLGRRVREGILGESQV